VTSKAAIQSTLLFAAAMTGAVMVCAATIWVLGLSRSKAIVLLAVFACLAGAAVLAAATRLQERRWLRSLRGFGMSLGADASTAATWPVRTSDRSGAEPPGGFAVSDPLALVRYRLVSERIRLNRVVGASQDGILIVDYSGAVSLCNPAAADLLGINGVDLERGISPPTLASLRSVELAEGLNGCLRDGQARIVQATLGVGGRTISVQIAPLQGDPSWAAVAFLHDTTEIRRLETMRRDFVGNVSHELRSPVASIKAAVETLQAGAIEDPAAAHDFLERMNHEADRLAHLVDEMLELARIESGQIPFRFELIDIPAIVDESIRQLAPLADRAAVTLTAETSPALPEVSADRERLIGALRNLVHNAIKFTPAGGSIAVRTASAGDAVEISVSDTGIGIAPADAARIFERFYKVDRARGSRGTGLGLAIVRHVAEAHGGMATVRSRPGQGSTFTIHLPAHGDPR